MDRRFVYIGAIPQDLDSLKAQKNAMVALGWMAQGVLGTSVAIDGLECTPTVPASLAVNVAPGAIYSLQATDDDPYGSLAADLTHQLVKQGISFDDVQLTATPPGTPGQAINYLVQAQFIEEDLDIAVLPYFNPASLTNPDAVAWSGPSNSGVSQPLTRRQRLAVTLKAGVAATAGSQVTPDPDVGYTGLYAITVAQGQTQITASDIVRTDQAPSPFLDVKLPQVPYWVQSGSYAWAEDASAVADAIEVALDPIPYQLVKGFGIRCKVANSNTGAATITITRGTLAALGPYPVVRATGSPLIAGDLTANQVCDLVYDGVSFRDITGTTTNTSVGSFSAQSGEGIVVLGDQSVNLAYYNLSSALPTDEDLFSFFDVEATHHRVLTWAQLLAHIGSGLGAFMGMQVITTTQVWSKPTGVNKVLAFAQGPGGGGGSTTGAYGPGGGGGSGELSLAYADLTLVGSVVATIGGGGTGVAAQSGNPGTSPTSFGTYAIANPGGGGRGADTPTAPVFRGGAAGAGGAPTGALAYIQMRGEPGRVGLYDGSGGKSFFAGGGQGPNPALDDGAAVAGAYGSGGGGGGFFAAAHSPVAGAKGGDGVILLLMFS